MTVATTILEQLGGFNFLVSTGAKNLTAFENGLAFKLPGGGGFCKKGINYVKIVLNPLDYYDITFGKIRKMDYKVVEKKENVFVGELVSTFEDVTGLVVLRRKIKD